MHNFRRLTVYNRALRFVSSVYRLTEGFPASEQFGLTSQFRRAAMSIVLNIAEGCGNRGEKEFARYLEFAIRSGYECLACLDLALEIGILKDESYKSMETDLNEIVSMLVGLQRSLTGKP